jgi:hypothetical protein
MLSFYAAHKLNYISLSSTGSLLCISKFILPSVLEFIETYVFFLKFNIRVGSVELSVRNMQLASHEAVG